jgi:hypothetical protein
VKTTWVVMYVVTHTCYIFTVGGTMFTDAASVQDAIMDVLRQSGIHPERMIVEGPYARVISDGLPYRVGVLS